MIGRLVALYPRGWRDRYGAEVAALATELVAAGQMSQLRAGLDLVAGAVVEWRRLAARQVNLAPLDSRESALALLRFADLGIDDVQVIEDSDQLQPRRRLQLIHRVEGQEVPFDLTEESAGTQTWFSLIDASLHPKLSARLLELFQDPKTNPNGAQLIFTTHDTSLVNHLNRDEVWLTEKDSNGATTLTALAEYGGDKVRRSLNLERAYLQGRFGAVPELDQFTLRRALGLEARDAG